MTFLLLFALPLLLLLFAVILFTWSAFTPRVQLYLRDVISRVQSVDLPDLQELVSPVLDSYFTGTTPQPLRGTQLRQAQRNRMKFTGHHFDRMLHNTVLYQSMARTAFDRFQKVDPKHYTETEQLIAEILDLATAIRVYLFAAKLKLIVLRWSRLYSQFGTIQANQLLELYCKLQDMVLELAKTHGYPDYENLLSAI